MSTLPPGYSSLVPLDRQRHAGLGLRFEALLWCRGLNSVYLSATEIGRACLDYPVVFVREQASGTFLPMVVLGLRAQQNLFVDATGRWMPHTYVPGYVRRYPFCIAELNSANGGGVQRLVGVQEDQLAPSAQPFFDSRGEATPAWTERMQLIDAMEAAQLQTREFTSRLDRLGLFTEFSAVAVPRGGGQLRLDGMFRIDEQKLNALDDEVLKSMMGSGEMRAIQAHLLSLEQFAKLMNMTTGAH